MKGHLFGVRCMEVSPASTLCRRVALSLLDFAVGRSTVVDRHYRTNNYQSKGRLFIARNLGFQLVLVYSSYHVLAGWQLGG